MNYITILSGETIQNCQVKHLRTARKPLPYYPWPQKPSPIFELVFVDQRPAVLSVFLNRVCSGLLKTLRIYLLPPLL